MAEESLIVSEGRRRQHAVQCCRAHRRQRLTVVRPRLRPDRERARECMKDPVLAGVAEIQ